MTTHLVHNRHSTMLGFIKGILFGFKSVCNKDKKGDGLWDASRANCPDCIKIYEGRGGEMNDAFTQYVAAVKPIHPDHPVTSIPRSVGDALARELEAARAIVNLVRSNCSHNYHGEDCPYGTDEDGNELEPSKWDTGEECECGLIEIQELLKAYDAVRAE